MGKTLLSHILYSCNKVDIDFRNFFTRTSNAHAISKFKNSELTAVHLEQCAMSNYKCLLYFESDGFHELLRLQFSYSKWHNKFPTIDNYKTFFNNNYIINKDELWNSFYSDVADLSWPACNSFDEIDKLPAYIKTEILSLYKKTNTNINNDKELLQLLVLSYYDLFKNPVKSQCSMVYHLSDYLSKDIGFIPMLLNKELGWDFDYSKSDEFFEHSLSANKKYILWFHEILRIYNNANLMNDVSIANLEVWEKAIIIAKYHEQHDINPINIKWDDVLFDDILSIPNIKYKKEYNN
jgi:hypothetical protein